jgi:glc operon protein GlcG
MNRKSMLLPLLAALAMGAQAAQAQEKRTMLTLESAKKMANACEQKAKAEGWKMNIAIMDAGGNLKYFHRMDDAFLGSVQIAQLKANTSAMFPMSTKQVAELTQTRVPGLAHVPGIAAFEGGLPIKTAGGEHIGSIGVSGATGEQDAICAQAGLDAVKNDIK